MEHFVRETRKTLVIVWPIISFSEINMLPECDRLPALSTKSTAFMDPDGIKRGVEINSEFDENVRLNSMWRTGAVVKVGLYAITGNVAGDREATADVVVR